MLRRSFLFFGVVGFLALAVGTASAVEYRPYLITDLGTLGGATKGYGINEAGQVAGESSNGPPQAFYWSGGSMTNLNGSALASWAKDINNDGLVMGYSAPTMSTRELWNWEDTGGSGTFTTLSFGTETVSSITAERMNNRGEIVGVYSGGAVSNQAFVHTGGTAGTLVNIGKVGNMNGSSFAKDINENGLVVGYGMKTSSSTWTPYSYDIDTDTWVDLEFAVAGGTLVGAHAVNDQGWMVVSGNLEGTARYYLWNGTTTSVISGPSGGTTNISTPHDLNNNGQVVGIYGSAGVLYDDDTKQTTGLWDLLSASDQSTWTAIVSGQAINEAGQITGYATQSSSSQYFGFLMTPTLSGDSNIDGSVNGTDLNTVLSNYNQTITGENKTRWLAGDFNCDGSVNGTDLNTVLSNYNQSVSFSSAAAVPEPSTLLLLILGLVGLLAWRRK